MWSKYFQQPTNLWAYSIQHTCIITILQNWLYISSVCFHTQDLQWYYTSEIFVNSQQKNDNNCAKKVPGNGLYNLNHGHMVRIENYSIQLVF